jgi:carboxymethylenebutenolidase
MSAEHVTLTAADGHQLDAYVAGDDGSQRSAIVLVQEIFGVNKHIRSVADDYAGQGFTVIAPALFDRAERNLELTYEPADMTRGMAAAMKIGLEAALKDVAAAIGHARRTFGSVKVGVLGYCFGGTLAWLAATRLDPAAAVCYYGGRIAAHATESPRCPVMMHFGSRDPHIPASEIATIKKAHPDLPLFVYDAGHGFNCDQRRDYEPKAAAQARQRTLEFLGAHLSGE